MGIFWILKNFHKLEKQCSPAFNGISLQWQRQVRSSSAPNNAHLSHFGVKEFSEELVAAKMSGHVHPEQLEECVYVLWMISERVWSRVGVAMCGCSHMWS